MITTILEIILYVVAWYWPIAMLHYAAGQYRENEESVVIKIGTFMARESYIKRYGERSYRNAKRWAWVCGVVWLAGIVAANWVVKNML